jgi:hypothetical protein
MIAHLLRTLSGSFLIVLWLGNSLASGQAAAQKIPRMAGGKPDFNGIWESLSTANWDLQDHSAYAGPMWEMGAIAAVPAGQGIVEGGLIPYLPAAAEKRKQNFANRRAADPEAKCYLPGIPRAAYLPYPFQIVQSNKDMLFIYQFATASRQVNMGKAREVGADSWMGMSNGHWEGDTLVVDVTGLNGKAWLDRAGDFSSDGLHVVERYTLTDQDHVAYEATLEDPKVFARPWKMHLTLYRRVEKGFQLMEFKCIPFAEELLYGEFRKQPGK